MSEVQTVRGRAFERLIQGLEISQVLNFSPLSSLLYCLLLLCALIIHLAAGLRRDDYLSQDFGSYDRKESF